VLIYRSVTAIKGCRLLLPLATQFYPHCFCVVGFRNGIERD